MTSAAVDFEQAITLAGIFIVYIYSAHHNMTGTRANLFQYNCKIILP